MLQKLALLIAVVSGYVILASSLSADDQSVKTLPVTKNAAVLRTSFDHQNAWQDICKDIKRPSGEGFTAHVDFIENKDFTKASVQNLLDSLPPKYPHSFLVIVDENALTTKDHAVLVVNLEEKSGKSFRALPSTIQSIENNLSIANMDFEEFANAVDSSGVFRGIK